ncbi:Urease accessory protein ureD [[Leptolyngbya] sp. PCC 7376]|uniref:urease accessory protein UreD n=1 Tax=[Leptolyngbya] sp. PCC 7376 TaxID=111781 RepID=UPI00029EF787|nr:urease accessory protein UreD [[Leptolyngbya] sp. PCC 7376]AFY36705.1 Urease accessory protein ureD [[Leptolyngbya] sp. PCC 7376]
MTRNNLEVVLKCDRLDQTIVTHQYTSYPLRLSGVFRLDRADPHRAYLYITNTSPGLLAGDELNVSVTLEAGASLHLTDQSATKIHAMPIAETKAKSHLQISVAEGASLEFVPEPLILFADSSLEQTTQIQLHNDAELFWSEIVLPGRLARGECYDFTHYFNRLEITSDSGERWFRDSIHLDGKDNLFKDSELFAAKRVLANIVIVQPNVDLEVLSQKLETLDMVNGSELIVSSSTLPDERGLLVRILANKTLEIKKYLKYALNCVRSCGDRPSLPYIPK